ncbi:hypothetical protein BASA83_001297 [Batrachochytrium salamandrivorans]|nr:hypothetical protein BASA83_001297 [Batrachochytrium salamandrivorans]
MARAGWWQQVTPRTTATTINKGIRLFTGARLSTAIGPLLVETGIGSLLTRSLVARVRLLERSVTKKTSINAICSSTDNGVCYTECPRAVGKIPTLVSGLVGPNSYTGTDTG